MKRLVGKLLSEAWANEGNQQKLVKLQRPVSGEPITILSPKGKRGGIVAPRLSGSWGCRPGASQWKLWRSRKGEGALRKYSAKAERAQEGNTLHSSPPRTCRPLVEPI